MKWEAHDGLIDVSSAFKGVSNPLRDLVEDVHRRGWTVNKIHVKDNQYLAEAKNPHGETLEATGRTDATAVANLLVRVMRREHMRASALREKVGAWDAHPLEQQQQQIAQAYMEAPVYEPKAAPAWMELAQDCSRRAETLRQQIAVEYTDDPVPYPTANEMREDVTQKKHIMVSRAYAHHPVWNEQQTLDYRLVHDVLGHSVGGGDWGWHGECLATAAHMPLLAEVAQKALFTEALGQSAFGSVYQQWGPQKIAFLDELLDKLQLEENSPGHSGVHPSQALAPAAIPNVEHQGAVINHGADPNDGWESNIQPLPDAAFMWQRADGADPLDSNAMMDNARTLESGVPNMHPDMVKQATVNALRGSLLGARKNRMGHAIHYQDLMGLPANVDDPAAYWDALEQRREAWNQQRGYAPKAHQQHWAEEQQFKQWVKAMNPDLDDGEVKRLAQRELLHMLTEEEERLVGQDPQEMLSAEEIEWEAYKALQQRLRSLTKPTVDQKVDFGDSHLWHEARGGSTTQWSPGQWGKGLIIDGQIHTWPTTDEQGAPHHATYLRQNTGLKMLDGPSERWSDPIVIGPQGHYTPNETYSRGPLETCIRTPERFAQVGHGLKYLRDSDKWALRTQGSTTATHHADMYPSYLASHLRPLATVSRHANALAEAAHEDCTGHKGHGHHFRSAALALGIPGVGPRQVSHAWLHVAPQTSQLAVIDPHLMETLGHGHEDMSDRDYFKFERELTAARDASGYNHVPLGAFSAGLHDYKTGGPGYHADHKPFRVLSPTPYSQTDWSQQPAYPEWGSPYWWDSTSTARDEVAKDFDRSVAPNFSKSEIPFAPRTSAASGRSPWFTHPDTLQRVTGPPGATLMQHLKYTMGHPSATDVWAAEPEYEVGKGLPSTLARVAAMTRQQLLALGQQLPEDQSTPVHRWPDGWSMRKLETYGDLHREGELMSNCWSAPVFDPENPETRGDSAWNDHPAHQLFGWDPNTQQRIPEAAMDAGDYPGDNEGLYYSEVLPTPENLAHPLPSDLYQYYSLRDADNLPHISVDESADPPSLDVEGSDGRALGRHNAVPKSEYMQRVTEWRDNAA